MSVFGIVSACFRKSWWLTVCGLISIFCLEMLTLYGPQLVKQAINMLATGHADPAALFRLVRTLVVLALGVAILRFFGRPMFMAFGRIVDRELREQFLQRVIGLPRTVSGKYSPGEIMARATYDIDNIQTASGYGFQAAFHSALTLIIALAYMVAMSPVLTLIAAVPMTLIPWLTRRQSKKFHSSHRAIQSTFASLTEESRDSLNAIRLIKAYDLADIKEKQFRQSAQTHLENNMRLAKVNALYSPVMTTIMHTSQATVWGFGGAMAVQGVLTPGDIVAFSAYLVMLKTPLTYSGYLVNLYQRAKSSRQRMEDILLQPAEKEATDSPAEAPRTTVPSGLHDIEIKNLTFSYPGESEPALRNLSLRLEAGITHALVGPVGSGKSTLLKLLTRIYDPPEGTIFWGAEDIVRMPIHRLRILMETAAQAPFVFSDSIRENMLLACPGAGKEELWRALDNVGLTDEINALPDKLDTLLGEKGYTLSGGQKARLALARSLLSNREFFLLDDPLSSVDTEQEASILRNLSGIREGRTNLIVSHRPLSIAFSSKIFVLEKGRLVAQGTHQDLLDGCIPYRQLVWSQQLTAKLGDG
ncbi:MAG: ABC transporter ATP-binding protein [Acidobacteriota bacterium]|jgi:ATP-binding cassette subfamily B protein|nr:ABC transporter ATP-binding protein [Acidobacteriota bacterium]